MNSVKSGAGFKRQNLCRGGGRQIHEDRTLEGQVQNACPSPGRKMRKEHERGLAQACEAMLLK